MLRQNPEIGVDTGTVNPVVLECNDGYLNDIRSLSVTVRDVEEALNSASVHCEEGAVGAGRGMSCFGLKGGIGTASRVLEFDGVPLSLIHIFGWADFRSAFAGADTISCVLRFLLILCS